MRAPSEEQVVANKVGTTIDVGSLELAAARSAMVVVGIMVSPEEQRTRKVHMAVLASSDRLFSSCRASMALMPKGVAALPNPRMLAPMASSIAPIAG